jgi:Ca2+-binding RTX toxin-like protein
VPTLRPVIVYGEKPQACTGRRLSSGLCYGDAGNDNLALSTDVSGVAYGGRGNDYFSSTLGAGIWFYGQEGDDTLVGNDEQTNMAGGRGTDTFVCNQEGEDIIVDYRPEQDGDVIENQVLR